MSEVYKKMGERKAIAEFHHKAKQRGITIKRFRMDRSGDQIIITAVEYSKM